MAANLYKHTSEMLNELLIYFKCSKCQKNVDTPCTLGSCDDIFCCDCALVLKNNVCPVCMLPAEAKDVHVDRQLFNMVQLCKRMQALLEDNVSVENDIDEDILPSQQLLSDGNDDIIFLQKHLANSGGGRTEEPVTCLSIPDTVGKDTERKLCVNDFGSRSPSTMTKLRSYKRAKICDRKKIDIDHRSVSNQKNYNEMISDQTTMTQYFHNMEQYAADNVMEFGYCSRMNENTKDCNRSQYHKKTRSDNNLFSPVFNTKEDQQKSRTRVLRNTSVKINTLEQVNGREVKRSPITKTKDRRDKKQSTPQNYQKHSTTRLRENKCQTTPSRGQNLFQSPAQSPQSRIKRNAKGETQLHIAAIKGDAISVEELLKSGANPNVQDNAGWSPLHEACNHGHSGVVKFLLENGALINIPGMDNDTPLHDAVNNNQLECVSLLMLHGASKTARNIHGLTPVQYAKTDDMMRALNTALDPTSTCVSNVITDTLEYQQPCLLATGLSRDQKMAVQKCANIISARLVDKFLPQVTHVVTSCNKQGMCPRTLKYLKAVLTGKWIVNMNWIDTCLEYKELVSPEAFEVPGTSTNPDSQSAYKGRMNRTQQLPGLFDGCQFYFHGLFQYPTPDKENLVDLVKNGGGHVLSREPKPSTIDDYSHTVPYHATPDSELCNCGLFILHDNNVAHPALRLSRLCSVPVSWLMDCIATFSLTGPHR